MKISRFEDFEFWKEAYQITILLYEKTNQGKFINDFGLRDQLRRSLVSITANIAEGFEKNNINEFIRYLRIAKGSVGEARSHLYIARGITYITESEFDVFNKKLLSIAKQLSGFIYYLTNEKNKRLKTKS